MDQVEKILANYREEMIKTLQAWVRIPSVKGEAAPGAPFGAEGYVRLSYAAADDRLREAMRRLRAFLLQLDAAEAM